MNVGMYPLSGAMVNQLNRLDMISNNIANVNTTGFKSQNMSEVSFNHYLQQTLNNKQTPDTLNTVINTIPHLNKKYRNISLGTITPSGNNLDFAINDRDGYFKLKDLEGNIIYSKDGEFKNLNGMLVNKNGFEVLDAEDNPINIVSGFEKRVSLVSIPQDDMKNLGNNTFMAISLDNIKTIDRLDGVLIQGAIEKSNVNMVKSMVNLVEATRQFERMQKAITGIDDINSKLIQKLGDGT
jgi:flagellar basal-body rod protein FlgG